MNTASVEAGLGVHGEHHPGGADVGAHHPLHAGRQRDGLVVEAVVHPVGDGPVVVERGEDLLDRGQDASMPRMLRKVSCWPANEASGRSSAVATGADRERHRLGVVGPPASSVVRSADVGLEIGREAAAAIDGRADLLAHHGELRRRRRCRARRAARDRLGQTALRR